MTHPTRFSAEPMIAHYLDLSPVGMEAAEELRDQNLAVLVDLCPGDIPAIQTIANQESVREFCPNDAAERFNSEAAAERPTLQPGGRRHDTRLFMTFTYWSAEEIVA